MAIGYWRWAIGYWLLAIGHWLLVIGYWLLAIGHPRKAEGFGGPPGLPMSDGRNHFHRPRLPFCPSHAPPPGLYRKVTYSRPLGYNVYSACPPLSDHQLGFMSNFQSTRQSSAPRRSADNSQLPRCSRRIPSPGGVLKESRRLLLRKCTKPLSMGRSN